MFSAQERRLSEAVIAIGTGVSAAIPGLAVDNMNCNWLGQNCRVFWGHGVGSSTVWNRYKHLDKKHGASSFGATKKGNHLRSDSGRKPASCWANSSLSGGCCEGGGMLQIMLITSLGPRSHKRAPGTC